MSKPQKRRPSPLRTNKLGERLAAIEVAVARLDEAQTEEQMLRRLAQLRSAVGAAIDTTMIRAHHTGSSWSMIGGMLNVSAQAAHQRVSRLVLKLN